MESSQSPSSSSRLEKKLSTCSFKKTLSTPLNKKAAKSKKKENSLTSETDTKLPKDSKNTGWQWTKLKTRLVKFHCFQAI